MMVMVVMMMMMITAGRDEAKRSSQEASPLCFSSPSLREGQ